VVARRWAIGAVVAVLAVACSVPIGPTPALRTDRIDVPAMPLPPMPNLRISADALDAAACEECERLAALGAGPDAARFFYGRLPIRATDRLFDVGANGNTAVQLGNLVVSGYFGGLYLRDSLGSIGVGAADLPTAPILEWIGAATLGGLDSLAGNLVRTARAGPPDEVRSTAALSALLLAAVHGYNRGYLETVLANPPAGVDPPEPPACPTIFDCRVPSLPLDALDVLAPTRDRLERPPDLTWELWSNAVHSTAAGSVEGGRVVWNRLLSTSGFTPGAYEAIVELSVGFLEVTQAALLASAEGVVGDVEVGRIGLVLTAGLLTWAGSYFLGLASPLPTDILPTLTCP
jgi:hypothetical protein